MTSTFHLMEDVQLLDERETDNLIEMQRGSSMLWPATLHRGKKKGDKKE